MNKLLKKILIILTFLMLGFVIQSSYAEGEPRLPPVPANPAEILQTNHSWFVSFVNVYDRFSGDLTNTHAKHPVQSSNTLDMMISVIDVTYIVDPKWSIDISVPYMWLSIDSTLPHTIPKISVTVKGIGYTYEGITYGIFRDKEQNLSVSAGPIFYTGTIVTEKYLGVFGKTRLLYRAEFLMSDIIPSFPQSLVVGTEDYLEVRLYNDSNYSLKPTVFSNGWVGVRFLRYFTTYAKLQGNYDFTFIGKAARVNSHLRHTTSKNQGMLVGLLGIRARLTGLKMIPNETLQIEAGIPLAQTKLDDQLQNDYEVIFSWAFAF